MERREFLGWLGTASVAALSMSAAGASAQGGAGKTGAGAGPAAPATPATPATPPAATPPSPDAQDLMSIARRRYGAHLSDEQAAELLAALDRGLQGSAALRKAKLTNGDEPDFVFRAVP